MIQQTFAVNDVNQRSPFPQTDAAPAAPPRARVLVAMSGGVDSSVAAYLLREQGYEVAGAFLRLGLDSQAAERHLADARGVAERLGVELHVVDAADAIEGVMAAFAAEYARGRTPNPCGLCNPLLKFGRLMAVADALGAPYLATGHHARVVRTPSGPAIARARAVAKDQSYVLFGLPRAALARVRLPIGELQDKAQVRRIAQSLGLAVADKPDSQEICFAPDGDYADILRQRAPEALEPGPIVDAAGRQVGTHGGIGRFTIGQRRGLRVAAGEPLYVGRIDAASRTVTIVPRAGVQARYLLAERANWQADLPAAPFRAAAQVRYNHRGSAATVRPLDGGRFEAVFDEPVHAVTPGQIAAVYDGERLLGGGWIVAGAAAPPA